MSDIRDALKRIATQEVQKNGVRSVSFRKLGAAVGVKSSSVIYHFRSKKELMRELAHDYMDAFYTKMNKIEAAEKQAKGRLQAFVTIFQDTLENDQYCFCGMLASDLDQIDDLLKSEVQQFFKRMEEWAARIIETDDRHDTREARELACVLISSLEGALLMDRTEARPTRLSAVRNWVTALLS